MRITDYHTRFVQSVMRLLVRDLDVVAGPPDPRWRPHAERVLRHTLRRRGDTCARAHPGAPQPRNRPRHISAERVSRCCDALLDALNGDWARPQLLHYCTKPGCPHKQVVMRAVIEAFELLFPKTPAENKWSSIDSPRAFVALMFQLCRVGTRAFLAEWPRGADDVITPDVPGVDGVPEVPGVPEAVLTDWKIINTKRLKSASRFVADTTAMMDLSLCNLVMQPVDACIQYLKNTGIGRANMISLSATQK